ncbi:hypothetical protein [Luteococcus sp.]|uniref:hypothetical protein n=1 Tax=Luteococcus sp. TaxID=1969402 RepID=UPI00373565E1
MIDVRAAVAVLACAGLLAGCQGGTEPAATGTVPSIPSSIPADSTTLAHRGFVHGPGELLLPAGLSITSRIDQPNVVTLTMPTTDGDVLEQWFTTRLPDGWVVEAARGSSVLFHGPDSDHSRWEGAATCSEQTCALALRHQRR